MMMKPIIPPAHIAPAGYRNLFFFGDFLNEEELGDLGILPRPVCIAFNPSRRWIIGPSGHATMIGQRDFNVYGVVHQIPDPEVVALDLHLDVPSTWDRAGALLRQLDGRLISSEYYVTRNRRPTRGKKTYVDRIANRAKQLGFPEHYIAELRAWRNSPIPRVELAI